MWLVKQSAKHKTVYGGAQEYARAVELAQEMSAYSGKSLVAVPEQEGELAR